MPAAAAASFCFLHCSPRAAAGGRAGLGWAGSAERQKVRKGSGKGSSKVVASFFFLGAMGAEVRTK